MLAHPTLDLLHGLGLHGMAQDYKMLEGNPEAHSLTHAEWLGIILEHEKTLREQKRFESRARAAHLRHPASALTRTEDSQGVWVVRVCPNGSNRLASPLW